MSDDRVVVVGGGAMGAATAWWLARSGRPVTLLEQYDAAHTHGSSHGSSRIFRFSYEDQDYVDLGVEAQGLWRSPRGRSPAHRSSRQVGCVDHGPREVVGPVHAALVARGVRCDLVSPEEAHERWPVLRFDDVVLVEHEAGRVDAGATVATLHAEAARLGADVRTGCAARAVHVDDHGVEVVLGPGHRGGVGGRARGRCVAARDARGRIADRRRTAAVGAARAEGDPGAAGLLPP